MADFIIEWESIGIAVAGGILPALLWLWFWLKEDYRAPEPTGLIAFTFVAGMLSVAFVFPVEKFFLARVNEIAESLGNLSLIQSHSPSVFSMQIGMFLIAATEEIAKYLAFFLIAFRSKHFDEPVDAIIYMITAALGFAAVENTLYIINDIVSNESVFFTAMNTNLRFLGSTIIHTIASAIVGIAFAFSFYRGKLIKFLSVIAGLAIAIALHAYFNLSIIETNGTVDILAVFSRYWIGIVGIIILIEIVKKSKSEPARTTQ